VNYSSIALFFMARFRRKRLRFFRAAFPPEMCHTIIDVGGTAQIWEMLGYPSDITIVNNDAAELRCPAASANSRFCTVIGDGRHLEYPDNAFDLSFSNSVIEHVGDWADMQRFADELQRVGSAFYCQTPNKWFPVEPHLGTLFLHWFPRLLQKYFVVRYCTLWGLLNKPTRSTAAKSIANIRLLARRDLKRLFPNAEILPEKFLFLTKSYVAIRRPGIPQI
jgi:methyltransferase family protein